MKKFSISSKSKKFIYAIILLIYVVVMIYAQLHHEFWRDELQAWTIARDLSIIDIFKQMQYEGHSCLWHLILLPFAKLGFSPMSMGFISVFFMSIAGFFIIYKSPFNFFVKLALLCSSPFLYFYSIQSRVYSIIPFVVCLVAMLYPKRMEKPLLFGFILALLVNTHAIMIPFAGIISLFFMRDIIKNKKYTDKKYWISGLIIICGLLLFFAQIADSINNNSIVYDQKSYDFIYSDNFLENLWYQCFYGIIYEIESFTGILLSNFTIVYIILIAIVFLIVALSFLMFKNLVTILIPMLVVFYFHTFIWFSIPQRVTMLLIYAMYAIWVYYYDLKEKSNNMARFYIAEVILCVLCVVTLPYGVKSLKFDINNEISGALDTSIYIESNLPDAEFICPVDYVATSVAGYIDKNIFYNNIRREYFSFVKWDQFWDREITFSEFLAGMNEFLLQKDNKNVYILYSSYLFSSYDQHISYLEAYGYIRRIYMSPIGDKQESYIIYEFSELYYEDMLHIT